MVRREICRKIGVIMIMMGRKGRLLIKKGTLPLKCKMIVVPIRLRLYQGYKFYRILVI